MSDIEDRLKEATINCPDCEDMWSDDQYTCATCWQEGGQGKINIIDYLKDHKEILNP